MNSAEGRCHDNARCESMWARFKEELLYGRYDMEKMTMSERKPLIWRYFMNYWNNRRICFSIGGLSPVEKSRRYYEQMADAASICMGYGCLLDFVATCPSYKKLHRHRCLCRYDQHSVRKTGRASRNQGNPRVFRTQNIKHGIPSIILCSGSAPGFFSAILRVSGSGLCFTASFLLR